MKNHFNLCAQWSVLLILAGGLKLACLADVIAGADFSHLGFFESRGIAYRDAGQPRDGFVLLKNRGLTCVRLRLFTSSAAQAQADPYNYINNLDYTVPLAVRAKNAGLRFMLDFHYSDTWADPGHQRKPAAWTNLSFAQLTQQMRLYNSNCIAVFKAAGALPDYVQVGNEITSGLLWPDGRVGGTNDTSAQWGKLAQLITNAITGISDAAGSQMPKIVIHIDRGGDWGGTQWFFDNLMQQHVSFDFIGESYYPFWHGPLESLQLCLNNAAARYRKPIIIAETAFPWTNSANVVGIPATPAGQVDFVAALARIVEGVPSGLGAGIYWWGSEYQQLSGASLAGFDSRSFFDSNGNCLPVVDALGQVGAPLRVNASLENGVLSLGWPLSGAAASVMQTTNLGPPATWAPVTNTIRRDGAWFNVTLPANSASGSFYRLQAN